MESAFASASAISDQRQKIEQYKHILATVLSSNDVLQAKQFVDHILSDDVPLVVSRQLLQAFAQELGKLEPEFQKEISHYTLNQIQPRVVSFEEQVLIIREKLVQKIHHNGVSEHKPSETSPFLRVKRLSEKATLPSRASPLSAGYDLASAVETKVPARGKALVPTDLSIAVPEGTYARIAPRSGLALKHSIDVGAGVVDADYRGPVGVILFNHSDVDFQVRHGDRIAQLIIQKIVTPEVTEVVDLDSTVRGSGGFGSTGV